MSTIAKIGKRQLIVAVLFLAAAMARALWPAFASMADTVFFALMAIGLLLFIVPLQSIRSLKAAGIELLMDAPHVRGAVENLNLDRIESEKLRVKLKSISHLLPAVSGAKVLWIDDRPEKIIAERRLLRALGVVVVSATSSDEAREVLRVDRDFDLIVSDVQRLGETHVLTGGVDIHEGVNFVVWLRTRFGDPFVANLPVLFYAAYDWPKLVEYTRPARETFPEPGISNSVLDFVPKILTALADGRDMAIGVPAEETPTAIRRNVKF